jgi:hypothetical protein
MTTTTTTTSTTSTSAPEQLTLVDLPAADVPVQFRLDAATRRRGLRHVAEIRARLETARPAPGSPAPPGRGTGRAA